MQRTGSATDVVSFLRQRRTAALTDIGELVLSRSAERVPVDTGELRDSGSAAVSGNRAVVGYRDSKATAVHEDMTSNFEDGRQAKFLESALNDSRADILRVAAERFRR